MNRLPECRYVILLFMEDLNLFGKDYNQIDSVSDCSCTLFQNGYDFILFIYIYVNYPSMPRFQLEMRLRRRG